MTLRAIEPFSKGVCRCVFEGLAFVCVPFNVHLSAEHCEMLLKRKNGDKIWCAVTVQ